MADAAALKAPSPYFTLVVVLCIMNPFTDNTLTFKCDVASVNKKAARGMILGPNVKVFKNDSKICTLDIKISFELHFII